MRIFMVVGDRTARKQSRNASPNRRVHVIVRRQRRVSCRVVRAIARRQPPQQSEVAREPIAANRAHSCRFDARTTLL